MVKNVKQFTAELQSPPFVQQKILVDTDVEKPLTRPSKVIAPGHVGRERAWWSGYKGAVSEI